MQSRPKTHKIRWKAARLVELRNIPPNPWCGMYSIYLFLISKEGEVEDFPQLNPDHSLCLVEMNLVAFKEEALNTEALDQIRRVFTYFHEQERGMIIRFLYDWDGNGLKNEPLDIRVILGHIEQLSSLFKEFARGIYTLQGLFIGSWGEMHGSRHLGAKSMGTLIHALDKATHGELFLAVRCPSQWREIFRMYDPPLEERAFNGDLNSRVGLFNDAILASATDYGTYGYIERAKAPMVGTKLSREDELVFQNRLCAGVPNGGELVKGDGSFSLIETYRTFRLMRLSYLNEDFDLNALNSLRKQKNIVSGKVWRGASAYEYLTGHLGYRYVVRKVRVQQMNGDVLVKILVQNIGFSCCYFPLEVTLFICNADGLTTLSSLIPTDTRYWQPDEPQWLEAELQCSSLADGEYRLEIGLSDPRSGKSVYLACKQRDEEIRQTLLLGNLRVRRR